MAPGLLNTILLSANPPEIADFPNLHEGQYADPTTTLHESDWHGTLPRAPGSRGRTTAHAATAFWGGSTKKPVQKRAPPIDCESPIAKEEDYLDKLELRAMGERAAGRRVSGEEGSPAEEQLEAYLAAKKNKGKATDVDADGNVVKGPPSAKAKAKAKAEKEQAKAEAKLSPKAKAKAEAVKAAKQKAAEAVESARQLPAIQPPKMPSRREILTEGPYPIEKRLGELVAHAYYLWGHAKFVRTLAMGSDSEQAARNFEAFARSAEASGHRLLKAGHIPMSKAPPHLPLAVSSLSPTLLLGDLAANALGSTGAAALAATTATTTTSFAGSAAAAAAASLTPAGSSATTLEEEAAAAAAYAGEDFRAVAAAPSTAAAGAAAAAAAAGALKTKRFEEFL